MQVVYIPPGTYTVSQTIRMNTDTILMGDATNPPIIKASSSWSGEATLLNGMWSRQGCLPHCFSRSDSET